VERIIVSRIDHGVSTSATTTRMLCVEPQSHPIGACRKGSTNEYPRASPQHAPATRQHRSRCVLRHSIASWN